MKLWQKQKIIFIDNLSSLLGSWIPVIQALLIISFQSNNKKISQIVDFIKNKISSWENFTQIAIKMPKIFNIFDAAMIETWEATGKIDKALDAIVRKEEKEYELSKKVKQALIYPASIVVVTIIMLTIIMTYIIPKIEWIYKESNVNLPWLTRVIINLSHFFTSYFTLVIWLLIFWIICFIYAYNHIKKFKYWIDLFVLKIPIFWEIIKKKTLINFADFLSTLLSSWITINKALAIITNAMDNAFYKDIIGNILAEVKQWKNLSSAMWIEIMWNTQKIPKKELDKIIMKNYAFWVELSTAVKIWEQTWNLANMLNKVSVRYTKEIDNTVKNLSTLLEPLIIIIIWWIVWTIVMAILLPFLNMVNVVK